MDSVAKAVGSHRTHRAAGEPGLKLSEGDSPGVNSRLLCKTGVVKLPGFPKDEGR